MDDAINKENDNFETPNIDVKISRYVQDKSKIRSQFMQRFAKLKTIFTVSLRNIFF